MLTQLYSWVAHSNQTLLLILPKLLLPPLTYPNSPNKDNLATLM